MNCRAERLRPPSRANSGILNSCYLSDHVGARLVTWAIGRIEVVTQPRAGGTDLAREGVLLRIRTVIHYRKNIAALRRFADGSQRRYKPGSFNAFRGSESARSPERVPREAAISER